MKKLNLAIAIALSLSIPLGVMAAPDNAGKQQAMEMHERSFDAVNKVIELPDAASDKAVEQSKQIHRHRLINKTGEGNGDGTQIGEGTQKQLKKQVNKQSDKGTGKQTGYGESVGALDRDRIQDKDQLQIHDQDQDRDRDQDRAMEMDQDQIRDTDHEFVNEPAMHQSIVEEPPMQQEQNETEDPGKQQGAG